ncbi:conjugative transfer signal peptidase TraF [Mesorhizobium sp. CC13]|uniref:conjugative transfer signal peptidase TraF n=1 Tax=Mesorhizobium sp. CC13 TaxID=3029194 RepID=UPI003267652C
MTYALFCRRSVLRHRRRTVAAVFAGLALSVGILAAGAIAGYHINFTPSEPLGFWRVRPLERPIAVGDLVFICPPGTAQFAEARARGYLRRGLCSAGVAPLIKTVIAIEGQRIEIDTDVRVDGRRISESGVVSKDGKGRALDAHAGGIVPAGNVFLHSPYSASWDSRYFGPIPASGVLGLAEEVLTYAP